MTVEIASSVLVSATAEAPADPYDLTDLATVHDELGIPSTDTSNDGFLQRAITQASSVIANYCNRTFAIEVIQDQVQIQQDPYPYQVPGGVDPLQLSRWPFVNATPVSFTGNTHKSIVVDGIASTAGVVAGMLIFAADGSIPVGTVVQQVVGSSLVLSQSATSSANGVSFTVGLQVVQTLAAGSTQQLTYGTDFTVDAKRGWLIRLNSWTGVSTRWESIPLTVVYQAGYDKVPSDLTDACLRLVTARFRARGRDPMLVERSQPQTLGTERFWVGPTPGQSGALSPEIASLVSQYRVPVVS